MRISRGTAVAQARGTAAALYVGAVTPGTISVYDTLTQHRTGRTSIKGEVKVARTGDGRTFFAVTETKVYRFRVTADGKAGATDVLPVKIPSGASPDALAASRDGTRLALALQYGSARPDGQDADMESSGAW